MVRIAQALVLAAGLVLVSAAAADEAPAASNWKVVSLNGGKRTTFWLIKLESKDGKPTISLLSRAQGMPASTVEQVSTSGGRLRFTIKMGKEGLTFDGKLPAQGDKKVLGSLGQDDHCIPAELERTTLKTLADPYETAKERMANLTTEPEVFFLALQLLGGAAENKAKPEEVRGWAEKAYKAAEPYGVRWQREMAALIADELAQQDGFGAIAVAYAQRAERMLEPKDLSAIQVRVLKTLAAALKKADRADDAKKVQARIDKLEKDARAAQEKLDAKLDEEYLKKGLPFKPEPFAGRKGKGDRTVLVELFTGTQCPPCVAADLAFDGLLKTYKPADVVLLQYHVPANGPDPLMNADVMSRVEYYVEQIDGAPTALFSGKAESGGGTSDEAKDFYAKYRKLVEPLLDKPAAVKLKASAVRKDNKVEVAAEVADLQKPGEKVHLRLALVEEEVRYAGSNGVRFHHHVVRAMPGGAKGLVLKEKAGKQTATVDLDELRKQTTKFLDDFAKRSMQSFPSDKRPMEMKKLSLIAFVQDDATKEVLQAVQVPVKAEKE